MRETPRDAGNLPGRVADLAGELGLGADGAVTPLIVAVSGGLDSVVLLHLLRFPLAGRFGPILAATFDHRMRPNSAADVAWVRGLCRAWDVPVTCGVAPQRPDSEADARALRYRFLFRLARRHDALILTAHHADDQAETVLFRLLRGAGTRGAAGIPSRRGRLRRPLLHLRRDALHHYARLHRVPFREDPTNRDPTYARNLIRHVMLPAMERAAAGTTETLLELGAAARALEDRWDGLLEEVLDDVVVAYHQEAVELARTRLLAYDAGVVARLLRHVLRRFGSRPGRAGTRTALEFITSGASGRSVSMPGGVELRRDFDRVRIGRARPRERLRDRPVLIREPGEGRATARLGGHAWRVRWWSGQAEGTGGHVVGFERRALRFPLTLRAWRAGDRIRLDYGTKKLKKLFGERRVPAAERCTVPVLVDASGAVLWVVGVIRGTAARPARTGDFEIRVDDVEHR